MGIGVCAPRYASRDGPWRSTRDGLEKSYDSQAAGGLNPCRLAARLHGMGVTRHGVRSPPLSANDGSGRPAVWRPRLGTVFRLGRGDRKPPTSELAAFASRQLSPLPVEIPHFPQPPARLRLAQLAARAGRASRIDRRRATPPISSRSGRRFGTTAIGRASQTLKSGRSHVSVIKRNWHLLPYEQLLALLRVVRRGTGVHPCVRTTFSTHKLGRPQAPVRGR